VLRSATCSMSMLSSQRRVFSYVRDRSTGGTRGVSAPRSTSPKSTMKPGGKGMIVKGSISAVSWKAGYTARTSSPSTA